MFSKRNVSLTATLSLALLALQAAPGLAGIIDDFEDGELFDGKPVLWEWALNPMDWSIQDGNLILSGGALNNSGILYLPVFEGWQDLRIKCRMVGPGRIGLANNMTQAHGGYFASIWENGDLVISRFDGIGVQDGVQLENQRGLIDPAATHQLEFFRDGARIEVRCWEVGVESPVFHTIAALDDRYVDGFPGIFFMARANHSRGIFYDFEICSETCMGSSTDPEPPVFLRGDTNSDGVTDIADPVYVLNHLFGGGPAPSCLQTADANDDNVVDIADPVYELNHLFGGGSALSAPVGECGTDPTPAENAEDGLSCEAHPPCE